MYKIKLGKYMIILIITISMCISTLILARLKKLHIAMSIILVFLFICLMSINYFTIETKITIEKYKIVKKLYDEDIKNTIGIYSTEVQLYVFEYNEWLAGIKELNKNIILKDFIPDTVESLKPISF